MNLKQTNSWLSLFLIAVLLGLLAVLAGLQYRWLGQISEAERVRLKSRLVDDTRRFAEDFNREIQVAYFGFQLSSRAFKEGEPTEFAKRWTYWRENAAYPGLVENVYFFRNGSEAELLKFDPASSQFVRSEWPERVLEARRAIDGGEQVKPILARPMALAVPVLKEPEVVEHIVVRTSRLLHTGQEAGDRQVSVPDRYGFLVVLLDDRVITQQMIPQLVSKYFSGSESADFSLAVLDEEGSPVFRNGGSEIGSADATAKMLDIRPAGFTFFAERVPGSAPSPGSKDEARMVVTERFESRNTTSLKDRDGNIPKADESVVDVNIVGSSSPNVTVFESKGMPGGAWTLKVQHNAGSLDQFVANTRNRNLAVSFGILGLLAVSMVLIFISSQRAKRLAQSQLDFVSSVSHEFRTPLAVIYSAAENLSDGVVAESGKILDYGALIKKEGRKLSGMVEQILEFAGARSGKRKYDLREMDVSEMVERSLEECRPQLEESGFEVEKSIEKGLPPVLGDEQALSQAVQNLISNAWKYSNGSRWIKVSVSNGGGKVRIAVEDRGAGISAKDQKQLFEPFFRARSVIDEQISGNGLGLSLVKQIVDAHHGTIEVTSEPGKGARFEIGLSARGEQ